MKQSKGKKPANIFISNNWAAHTKGLGQEIWTTVNIDDYINDLRYEWHSLKESRIEK